MILLCLCLVLWLPKTGESTNGAAPFVATGRHFLPARRVASLTPGLSIPYLPDSHETFILSQSCQQCHCNKDHHQQSAHCGVATTCLGLVPETHVVPSSWLLREKECGAASSHGCGRLPALCKTMIGCYLICPVER